MVIVFPILALIILAAESVRSSSIQDSLIDHQREETLDTILDHTSSVELSQSTSESQATTLRSKALVEESSQVMCAVLEVDFDSDRDSCSGLPRKRVTIACQPGPGSKCVSFDGTSAKDTYCDDSGFYETVYPHKTQCLSEPAINFFPKDTCFRGAKFISCIPGPCGNQGEKIKDILDVVVM